MQEKEYAALGVAENTHLNQTLNISKDKEKYDTYIKELLADKQVLARVLKYSLDEFMECTIDEIISEMDEPEISTVKVDPGQTNEAKHTVFGKVERTTEEDNVPGEGKLFYDIRFSVYHGKNKMKFLINLEAQKSTKSSKLGYELDNRIIFYLCRMVSAQKEVEFTGSNYDDIKHVRSIWICMDSNEDEDSINQINLEQKALYGKDINLNNLDKVVGVIIRIRKNENAEESKNILIAMLEELVQKKELSEKKKNLVEKYGFVMTEETERRVRTMCNWSDVVFDDAMIQGLQAGMEQGRQQGMQQGLQEGMQQGLQEGMQQALQRSILDFLVDIGEVSESLQEKVKTIKDLEVLGLLNKKAARAISLEEFAKCLEEV